jgi:hypothetical protein
MTPTEIAMIANVALDALALLKTNNAPLPTENDIDQRIAEQQAKADALAAQIDAG